MAEERQPEHSAADEPLHPLELPAPLAEFLRGHTYACMLQETDQGSVFICKALAHEIRSVRGVVPIRFLYQLYEQPAAPVIRTVVRIYAQPDQPLALEC